MNDADAIRRKKLDDLLEAVRRAGYGAARGSGFSLDEIRQAVRKSKALPRPPAAAPIVYRRDGPRPAPHEPDAARDAGPAVPLDTVGGCEVTEPGRGKAYVVRTRVRDLEEAPAVDAAFRDRMAAPDSAIGRRLASLCGSAVSLPADILFLDVESTGLGASMIFLVGAMVWQGDGFEVVQYLARHYGEEAAAISMFLDACAARRLLVTFNGKSFDFPFVRARAAANGVPFNLAPAHVDLLHECRRAWRHELPNCRLVTLEQHICGRGRSGDIPSSEIPAAYHAFVRTGNAARIVEILRHNARDLVTLAELMTRLP